MNKLYIVLLSMFVICVASHQQAGDELKFNKVNTPDMVAEIFMNKMLKHIDEFLAMANQYKNMENSIELELSIDLNESADRAHEYASALQDMFTVNVGMVCEKDKWQSGYYTRLSILRYIRSFGMTLREITSTVNRTKIPAMAIEGKEMKKEIEEFMEFLNKLHKSDELMKLER